MQTVLKHRFTFKCEQNYFASGFKIGEVVFQEEGVVDGGNLFQSKVMRIRDKEGRFSPILNPRRVSYVFHLDLINDSDYIFVSIN